MAYQNNFVVSLIHRNRPLREFSENNQRTCVVPFGSEYKIRLKNKTNKRAKVKVFIDGMDVNFNSGAFVLNAHQTLDLERFVEDLNKGKKFKFISVEEGKKTGEIADPTSEENGLIRVEFHPEVDYNWWYTGGTTITLGGNGYYTLTNGTSTLVNNSSTSTFNSVDLSKSVKCADTTVYSCNASSTLTGNSIQINPDVSAAIDASTKGATVEGAESNQQFSTTWDFQTESPTVITLKMRGPKSDDSSDRNLQDALDEINKQLEQSRKLEKELEDLKRKVQPPQGFEVVIKNNLILVKLNGKDFTDSKTSEITLSDKGLKIKGKGNGINVETVDYKLTTG